MFRRLIFNVRNSFRMWMRNRTRPMTIMEAEEKKLFWAKVYMFSAFAALILVSHSAFINSSSDEFSKNIPVSKKVFDKMDDQTQIRVIKYTGFKKTSDVIITKEDAIRERDLEKSEVSEKIQ